MSKKKIIDPFPVLSLIDDPLTHKINADIFVDYKFNNLNTKKMESYSRKEKIKHLTKSLIKLGWKFVGDKK